MSYANPNRQNRQDARQRAQSQQNSRRRNRGGSNQQEPAASTPSTTPTAPAGSGSNAGPAATASAPSAVQQGRGGGSFSTVPGELTWQNIGGLVDLANKYKDNETVSGFVIGKIADSFATGENTSQAIRYNDAFLGSLGKYQAGQEDLKTGNTMKLMAAEGGIASSLLGQQGAEQRANYREEGEQTRLGYRTQGEEQRAGYRTMGEQERLTQGDKTNQELRLRADARGAIRSQGARFYG